MKSRMIGTAVAFALAVVSALTVTADDVTLPAGYTKLDYIASTGTQYINTGIKLPNRTSLQVDFGYLAQEGHLFGCNLAQGGYLFLVGAGSAKFYGTDATSLLLGGEAIRALGSNKFHLEIVGGDGTQESGAYVGQMTITQEGGTKILDGKKVGTSSTQGAYFGVFSNGAGGGRSSYRLYGLSATDPDGKALFDLVPCINPDGVIGVYDLAGSRFLSNSGTGTFLTPSDDEHDLVENGCFDNSQITDVSQGWNYGSKCTCPGWAMEGSIGLGKPGCTFVNASLYVGNWAMFLQSNSSKDLVASQTVTVDVPGTTPCASHMP